AKARTIAGYLGADYAVESSVGHIRDLPGNASEVPKKYKGTDAGRLGIDVENHFQPIYVIPKKKKDVVNELKDALRNASELYLATDEDREGEAISWHVLEVLGPDVPVRRMVFHEITRTAIEDAIQNWRELDMKLVEAQEGRRVLDRLVGYEMSPVLWKKVMPRLSAGRVQSVATRIVVERERARMRFRAANYWDIEGTFALVRPAGERVEVDGEPSSLTATLVTLDGDRVATGRDFDPETGRQARELYGDAYVPPEPRRYVKKVKNAQEAHEAIRPAGDWFRTPGEVAGELPADEARLYELIWQRTLASQMADAVGTSVSIRLTGTSATGEQAEFAATGKTITFAGFLRAYVEG